MAADKNRLQKRRKARLYIHLSISMLSLVVTLASILYTQIFHQPSVSQSASIPKRYPAFLTSPLTENPIANHLGGLHSGAQFTLGEATTLTAAVLSLGMSLDQVAVLTRNATISYQKAAQGDLTAHARVMHEECKNLQTAWDTKKRARLSVPVELIDATGQMTTVLNVECLVLPRA